MQPKISTQVADNNPFVDAWNDGADNEKCYERNNEHKAHNVIAITEIN